MVLINKALNTQDKLNILAQDSQYDLACACGSSPLDRRSKSADAKWIYPVALPQKGYTFLFKTLVSNHCQNDCKYCPLRQGEDKNRYTLTPDEIATSFGNYYRNRKVSGLFLSSGVIGSADQTMTKINDTAHLLRRQGFKGYIHLKIIPGSSQAAIEQTLSLANTVSLNIETAGVDNFKQLSQKKDYLNDIIAPLKLINQLTSPGSKYAHVRKTTQFIVGAAKENDQDIVKYSWGLYNRVGLNRIYFSAYQPADKKLITENDLIKNQNHLTREHRLYQVDFLIRKYGFKLEDIPFENNGNLSLTLDPKEHWAKRNPQLFPMNINKVNKRDLLKIPGIGELTANKIWQMRNSGKKIKSTCDLKNIGRVSKKVQGYITF